MRIGWKELRFEGGSLAIGLFTDEGLGGTGEGLVLNSSE